MWAVIVKGRDVICQAADNKALAIYSSRKLADQHVVTYGRSSDGEDVWEVVEIEPIVGRIYTKRVLSPV
jgi:hypothetical protein